LEQGVLITGRVANRRGDFCSCCLPASVIFLFDDVGEHESVAMPSHCPDVGGLSRIVTERPAESTNCLAQCAVRHHHVAPHAIEDVAAMDGLVAALDQENQEVEITGNEAELLPATSQR